MRRLDELIALHASQVRRSWVAAVGPDLGAPTRSDLEQRSVAVSSAASRCRLVWGVAIDARATIRCSRSRAGARSTSSEAGARIGVPRSCRGRSRAETMPDHEISLLAGLIADGTRCADAPFSVRPRLGGRWTGGRAGRQRSSVWSSTTAATRHHDLQCRAPTAAATRSPSCCRAPWDLGKALGRQVRSRRRCSGSATSRSRGSSSVLYAMRRARLLRRATTPRSATRRSASGSPETSRPAAPARGRRRRAGRSSARCTRAPGQGRAGGPHHRAGGHRALSAHLVDVPRQGASRRSGAR